MIEWYFSPGANGAVLGRPITGDGRFDHCNDIDGSDRRRRMNG